VSEETFRLIVASGVAVMAVFLLVVAVASLMAFLHVKKLMDRLEPALKAAGPLAQQAQEMVALMKPRILKVSADVTKITADVTKIAGDATEVSALVVTEAKRYAEISKDVGDRAKVKIAQFDSAVDDTVVKVEEASGVVKNAVMRPLHHIDGVVAGLRTAIQTYANGGNRHNMYGTSQYRAAHDEEMFI